MSTPDLIPPLFFLYAETHFRFFRGFPSLLYRKAPEIVADIPRRIAPDASSVPLLVLVNDTDKYKVDIERVTASFSQSGSSWLACDTRSPGDSELIHPLCGTSRAFLFRLPTERVKSGEFFVNCRIALRGPGRSHEVLNDNLPGTAKAPLRCTMSAEDLPGHEWCLYGDLHAHSHYSRSHVEFGPPVSVMKSMADSYGIDFAAVTDHSYDLCCRPDDFLATDPGLTRWNLLQREIAELTDSGAVMIPGEEISIRNARGKVVHLCALGLSDFLPGSRDGARGNSLKSKMLSVSAACQSIHDQGGLAVAAHPGAQPGLFEQLFLGRGKWELDDISRANLDLFQALNGEYMGSWLRGRSLWKRALLHGHHIPLAGGNDSHGDYNRYRAISLPFVSISENYDRYFARSLTGTYTTDRSLDGILASLKSGRTFVTDGPFLTLSLTGTPEDASVGRTVSRREARSMTAILSSTPEFGVPERIGLFTGSRTAKLETVQEIRLDRNNYFKALHSIELSESGDYIRAEGECRTENGRITRAVTSPVYILD